MMSWAAAELKLARRRAGLLPFFETLQQRGITGFQFRAVYVNENPTIRSFKFQTARPLVRADHLHAIGVSVHKFVIHERVVEAVLIVPAGGFDLARASVIGAVAELADVDDVRAAVGHFAAAVA